AGHDEAPVADEEAPPGVAGLVHVEAEQVGVEGGGSCEIRNRDHVSWIHHIALLGSPAVRGLAARPRPPRRPRRPPRRRPRRPEPSLPVDMPHGQGPGCHQPPGVLQQLSRFAQLDAREVDAQPPSPPRVPEGLRITLHQQVQIRRVAAGGRTRLGGIERGEDLLLHAEVRVTHVRALDGLRKLERERAELPAGHGRLTTPGDPRGRPGLPRQYPRASPRTITPEAADPDSTRPPIDGRPDPGSTWRSMNTTAPCSNSSPTTPFMARPSPSR